LISEQI